MSACSVPCGGRCCQRFPLSVTPARLGEMYQQRIACRDDGGVLNDFDRDVIMVAEMVIPLAEESDEQPFYTCRHFDAVAGLCTVYEQRPAMCRDYPGYGTPGRSCEQCGYVWEPAATLVALKLAKTVEAAA